ncbi:MAG: hypothetical protein EBT06_00740 [Gammaproteobacteria bacterium]|nr:hypothetical protein [Gammaproteobacteria bacterium]
MAADGPRVLSKTNPIVFLRLLIIEALGFIDTSIKLAARLPIAQALKTAGTALVLIRALKRKSPRTAD